MKNKRKFLGFTLSLSLFSSLISPNISYANSEPINAKQVLNDFNYASELPKNVKEKTELLGKREKNSKTFINSKGKVSQEVYFEPIHWRKKSGNWQEIDNSLVQKNKNKKTFYQNKSNAFNLSFEPNSNNLIDLSTDDYHLTFSMANIKTNQFKTKENELSYTEALPHTDFNYTSTSTGVKENIVLKNNKAPLSYTFLIDTDLTAKEKNGILLFLDEENKEIFRTSSLFAIDSKDAISRNIDTELSKTTSGYSYTISLDKNWMQDKERSFPITVDPSLTYQYTSSNTMDSFVYDSQPTTSYHDLSYFRTGYNGYGKSRSFIQLTLPELYPSAEITSAQLQLYHYGTNNPGNTLQAYPITTSWSADKLTWDTQPKIDSTMISSTTGVQEPENFDITSVVKDWYKGTRPNYGIMIRNQTETDAKQEFLSSENPTPTKTPKITINYAINPVGSDSAWSFDDNVNLMNGNLFLEETDVNLNGRGIPISIGRFYNSLLANEEGEFGKGWYSSFSDKLYTNDSEIGKVLRYRKSNGVNYYFTKINGVWESSNSDMTLSYDKEKKNYVMTDNSQTVYVFDFDGNISSITDSNQNSTIFTKTNGKITGITDASGRTVNITYTDNLITKVSGTDILTYDYVYNSQKHLTEVNTIGKDGKVLTKKTFSYDASNRLTTLIDKGNNQTLISYDTSGRVGTYTQPISDSKGTKNLVTSYSYGNGYVIKSNPKGIKTKYVLNDIGNIVEIDEDYNESTQTSSRQTKWTWDQNNLVSKFTDSDGNNTNYTYDSKNNISSIQEPNGYQQISKYDSNNNLTQQTGLLGQTLKNYYDKKNNLTDSVSPSSATSLYRYDNFGNVISQTKSISLSNNLILNSGFEKWNNTPGIPDFWFLTSGQTGVISQNTTRKNGNFSVKLSSSDAAKNASITSDYTPIEGNKTYSFAFQSKTTALNTNGKLTGSIKWYASDYSTLVGQTPFDMVSGTNDWIRHSKSFSSPNGAVFARIVFNSNQMDAYIDNVQLEEGMFINSYSYVVNGDFETDNDRNGQPDSFTTSNTQTTDGIDTSTKSEGIQCLLINGNSADKSYSQTINYSGKKGSSIILSGNALTKGISSTGGPIELSLDIIYSDGTTETKSLSFLNGYTAWKYGEIEIIANKDFKQLIVRPHVKNQTGKIWFDDIGVRLNTVQQATISDYNLAPNSSFEYVNNGNVVGWTVSYGTSSPYWDVLQNENAFIGKRAFNLQPNGGYMALTTDYLEARKSNVDYTATIVAKSSDVTAQGAYLKIRVYDANNNSVGEKISPIINQDGDWKRILVTLNRNEFPTGVKLKALIETPTGTYGNFLFDSIRLQEDNLLSTRQYDSKGNYIISDTDQEGTTIKYLVDNQGKVTQTQFPTSQENFVYNELGDLIKTYDSSNLETTFDYDVNGKIKEIKYVNHENGNLLSTYQFKHNRFGNLLEKTNPLNQTTSFSYDELGRMIDSTKADGTIVYNQYDNLNNLVKTTNNKNNETWDFTYDKNENITSVKKNEKEIKTINYDSNIDKITSIVYPIYGNKQNTTSFNYNPNGDVTNYTFSAINTPVLYQYDSSGKLFSLTGANGQLSKIISDESNRTIKSESTIGTSTTFKSNYEYDNVGQLTRKSLEGSKGNLIEDEKITYDNQGNIISISHLDGSYQKYIFDSSNRLTKEEYYNANNTLIKSIGYTYDVLGNRTKKTEDGVDTTYQFDAANRLANVNKTNIIFDSNGNLINDNINTLSYNVDDQITDISNNVFGTTSHYEYDESGSRIKKVVGEKVEYYYYINNNLSHVTDNNNNIKYEYTRDAQGNLFTMTDYTGSNPKIYYYQLNMHGDVVGLYNTNGEQVVSYSYDSFGNMLNSSGIEKLGNGKLLKDENPFRYSSYYFDVESGLYYVSARYYDSKTGRFTSEDPIESDNLYMYSYNNPLKFVDMTGNASVNIKVNWWDVDVTVITKKGTTNVNLAPMKISVTSSKSSQNSCGHCFTAGTTVSTDKGDIPIENIQYGDKVLSKNEKTGELSYEPVIGLFQKNAELTYSLYIDSTVITATGNHPFWVKEKQTWVNVEDLRAGQHVVDENGNSLLINKITSSKKQTTVYNLTVANNHNYYVSNLGVWVHNLCYSDWNKGSFKSPKASVEYHFREHGKEVNASTIEQYMNKANEFKKNLKNSSKSCVPGRVPNVTRYKKNGRYIDLDRDKKIVSFGKS